MVEERAQAQAMRKQCNTLEAQVEAVLGDAQSAAAEQAHALSESRAQAGHAAQQRDALQSQLRRAEQKQATDAAAHNGVVAEIDKRYRELAASKVWVYMLLLWPVATF